MSSNSRPTILGRIAERLGSGRWGALSLEIALIVVGILFAFQLDRAWQASQERDLERSYLERLADDLRRDLAEYYGYIEEQQRLGLGEDDQDRFRLETLGLLPGDVLASLEDSVSYPFDLQPAVAERIGRDFAARTEAHAWLGRLMKYQVLMARLGRDFRDRGTRLLSGLEGSATVSEIRTEERP